MDVRVDLFHALDNRLSGTEEIFPKLNVVTL